MELICLGLNHRTAPVDVRERFAVAEPKLGEASGRLRALDGLAEGVVISTCNRTEYYAVTDDPAAGLAVLREHFKGQAGAALGPEHLYDRSETEVAWHLCRVVSGMDSMVLG